MSFVGIELETDSTEHMKISLTDIEQGHHLWIHIDDYDEIVYLATTMLAWAVRKKHADE